VWIDAAYPFLLCTKHSLRREFLRVDPLKFPKFTFVHLAGTKSPTAEFLRRLVERGTS